jgi:hypothetical protein
VPEDLPAVVRPGSVLRIHVLWPTGVDLSRRFAALRI